MFPTVIWPKCFATSGDVLADVALDILKFISGKLLTLWSQHAPAPHLHKPPYQLMHETLQTDFNGSFYGYFYITASSDYLYFCFVFFYSHVWYTYVLKIYKNNSTQVFLFASCNHLQHNNRSSYKKQEKTSKLCKKVEIWALIICIHFEFSV